MYKADEQIQLFYNQLPKELPVSRNINNGIFNIDKKKAYRFQWSASRQKSLFDRFIVDWDEDKATEHWSDIANDTGLQPNLVVQNPFNLSCHLHFVIKDPISNYENSLSKPYDYFCAVRRALSTTFQGDPAFTGYIAKNPTYKGNVYDKTTKTLSDKPFRTYSCTEHQWSLMELSLRVTTPLNQPRNLKKSNKQNFNQELYLGKNDGSFKKARIYAYSITARYKETGNYDGLFNQVLDYIDNIQESFDYLKTGVLSSNEKSQIARSITNYCMNPENKIYVPKSIKTTKDGKIVNIGRDKNETLHLTETKDKQTYAGIKTGRNQIKDSERKIRGAVYDLKIEGKKVTQKAISERVGISTRQLRKLYKELIESLK